VRRKYCQEFFDQKAHRPTAVQNNFDLGIDLVVLFLTFWLFQREVVDRIYFIPVARSQFPLFEKEGQGEICRIVR
jgi:hypothetical protein